MRPRPRRMATLFMAVSLAACSAGVAWPSGGLTETQAFAAARSEFPAVAGRIGIVGSPGPIGYGAAAKTMTSLSAAVSIWYA